MIQAFMITFNTNDDNECLLFKIIAYMYYLAKKKALLNIEKFRKLYILLFKNYN